MSTQPQRSEPLKCALCHHGPHPDSYGHSYRPRQEQPPATDDAFKPEDCGRLWYFDKYGQKLWYSDARPLPATDDRVKEQGELQWVVKKVRLERYTDYELWCGNQWVSSGLQQAPASKIADFLNGRHK